MLVTPSRIRTWDSFIEYLSRKVTWDKENGLNEQMRRVEWALQELAEYPEQIVGRITEVASNDSVLDELLPQMHYPREIFDIFVLHKDAGTGFEVRFHRFRPDNENGGAIEPVHSHRWTGTTLLLKGGYEETVYSVNEVDEKRLVSRVERDYCHTLSAGETNSFFPETFAHQIINRSERTPCLTLFVRGKSYSAGNKIFDLERDTFCYAGREDAMVSREEVKATLKSLSVVEDWEIARNSLS